MNKYVVNGFKFTTEEYSKYKKTNNSGVWVKGGDGTLDGVDYYGVLKEVLEMEYSGWPTQKLYRLDASGLIQPQKEVREKSNNIISFK